MKSLSQINSGIKSILGAFGGAVGGATEVVKGVASVPLDAYEKGEAISESAIGVVKTAYATAKETASASISVVKGASQLLSKKDDKEPAISANDKVVDNAAVSPTANAEPADVAPKDVAPADKAEV